jgi:DUF4097 and DUF4098 domain-containing protein YvlB
MQFVDLQDVTPKPATVGRSFAPPASCKTGGFATGSCITAAIAAAILSCTAVAASPNQKGVSPIHLTGNQERAKTETFDIATVTIQPSASGPATETMTFALQSGGTLNITSVTGDIKVSAWDRDEAALTAKFKPTENNGHLRIEAESSIHSLTLTVKYPGSKNFGGSCKMELKVPRRLMSNITTVTGGILFDSMVGSCKAATVNGGINFVECSGNFKASTVNGEVTGTIQVQDTLDMSTVNGNISVKLSNPDGTLVASKENGSVKLETPGARDITINKNKTSATFGNSRAKMNFSAVNGSIVIQ